jgi:hypothetical protein
MLSDPHVRSVTRTLRENQHRQNATTIIINYNFALESLYLHS